MNQQMRPAQAHKKNTTKVANDFLHSSTLKDVPDSALLRNPTATPSRDSRFAHDFSQVPLGMDQWESGVHLQRQINHPIHSGEGNGIESQLHNIVLSEPREVDISRIKSRLNAGTQLDQSTRKKMELSMGRSFDQVRIHTDPIADALCRQFQARAFTLGNDIAFANGEYLPNTTEGRKIVAHELTHVVQQGEAPQKVDKKSVRISSPLEPAEREAERVANEITSMEEPTVGYTQEATALEEVPEQTLLRVPRPLPSGAPIFELVIDSDFVIRTLQNLNRGSQWPGAVNFNSHPITEEVRRICGGNYFRGNNFWSSGWVDDEWPDWLLLGLTDVDVKVDLFLKVDNIREVRTGGGTFTSGGATTESRTRTESTAVSGGAEGSVGGHEGALGGKGTGGVSHTTSSGRTLESRGESGLSMDMPAVVNRADVIMTITLHQDATFTTAKTYSRSITAGSVTFGGPTP